MKNLLLVGHPGHELRVLGWVNQTKPNVVVLTHGDGALNQPRIADSRRILNELGVTVRSDWVPPVSDQIVYQSLLDHDNEIFAGWLEQLVDACASNGITRIVADEAEGYNPTHDLCRVLANQVVRRLSSRGLVVENLSFPLVGHPCDPNRVPEERMRLSLSSDQLQWKHDTIRDYANRLSPILLKEVDDGFSAFGLDAFGTECFYAGVSTAYEGNGAIGSRPYFETYGEKRFKEGVYKHVIRASHLQAIAQSFCPAERSA